MTCHEVFIVDDLCRHGPRKGQKINWQSALTGVKSNLGSLVKLLGLLRLTVLLDLDMAELLGRELDLDSWRVRLEPGLDQTREALEPGLLTPPLSPVFSWPSCSTTSCFSLSNTNNLLSMYSLS